MAYATSHARYTLVLHPKHHMHATHLCYIQNITCTLHSYATSETSHACYPSGGIAHMLHTHMNGKTSTQNDTPYHTLV